MNPDKSNGTALWIPLPWRSSIVGLGELNMGGGGIGPISDTGIGGSGNSDSVSVAAAPCLSGGGVPLSGIFWKAMLWGASEKAKKKKRIRNIIRQQDRLGPRESRIADANLSSPVLRRRRLPGRRKRVPSWENYATCSDRCDNRAVFWWAFRGPATTAAPASIELPWRLKAPEFVHPRPHSAIGIHLPDQSYPFSALQRKINSNR